MQTEKLRYSVSRGSVFVKLAVILLGLSVIFRLVGCWGFWNGRPEGFLWLQIILPVSCCLLFAGIVLFFGEKLFSLTAIPVFFGAVFFIAVACDSDGWFRILLGIAFSIIVAAVYVAAVFGVIRTKWLLLPDLGLPFLFRVFVNDRNTILANENAMSLNDWLPELSVLCILLALFFIVFAMKKKEFPKLETVEGIPQELSSGEIIDILELGTDASSAAEDHKESDNE